MDPTLNSSVNTTRNEEITLHTFARIFLELFTVVSFISFVANILIITVIVKYRILRRDVTNVLILHLNLAQATYLFFTPITWRVFVSIQTLSNTFVVSYCIINETEAVIMLGNCLLLILLLCDWYLKTYSKDKYQKFEHTYKFFLGAIYFILLLLFVITVQFCLNRGFIMVVPLLVVLCYFYLMIFLIVMNIVHWVKLRRVTTREKNHVGLAFANMFVLAWCPGVLVLIIEALGWRQAGVALIFTAIGFSSPIWNLIYLFCCDNNFNVFFKKLFNCASSEGFDNEVLEDCTVTFHKNEVPVKDNNQAV